MVEVRSKNFLVKIFFCYIIVGFKVMGCSNFVLDLMGGWILCQVLIKFWEFCGYKFLYLSFVDI